LNTATLEGAPDRTAPRAGIDYGSALRAFASVEPRAHNPYALPPWGILVIRCEEKTVITDSYLPVCERGSWALARMSALIIALAAGSR